MRKELAAAAALVLMLHAAPAPAQSDGNAAIAEWMRNERLRFEIPFYRSYEPGRHDFFISHFSEGAAGIASARPDESGVLDVARPFTRTPDGLAGFEHVFFHSADRETGERRYHLALRNFPLRGFVNALALGLSTQGDAAERASGGPAVRPQSLDPFAEDVVVPHLEAANLTLEQALELLRRESGCTVQLRAGTLAITRCN